MARLSPARVRIGRAVPTSRVELVNGRIPPSMTSSRSKTSPMLAAGALAKRSSRSRSMRGQGSVRVRLSVGALMNMDVLESE